MYPDKINNSFATNYPEIWEKIKQKNTQFLTRESLISSITINLKEKFNPDAIMDNSNNIVAADGNWYMVSMVKRSDDNGLYFDIDRPAFLVDVLERNLLYFLITLILSGTVGFVTYYILENYSKNRFDAKYDSMTETYNRKAGIEKINKLFPMNDRRQHTVSLCFIDVNGLKEVNDTLGHKYGDDLITTVTSIIKQTIRSEDFLIRLGGDEFLIVFDGIDASKAEIIWKRIVANYEVINNYENKKYLISVSHGIVDLDNKQKEMLNELIEAADEKMYNEKETIKSGLSVIKIEEI